MGYLYEFVFKISYELGQISRQVRGGRWFGWFRWFRWVVKWVAGE